MIERIGKDKRIRVADRADDRKNQQIKVYRNEVKNFNAVHLF